MKKEDLYKEKNEEHFEHARRIIELWPEWKQEIGFAPFRNTDLNYRLKEE